MRLVFTLFLLFILSAPALSAEEAAVALCFTPGEDCDRRLTELIDGAAKTVRVAAYSLTSEAIADALIRARNRNIRVWVVLDRSQWTARRAQGHRLRAHGVGVRYDCEHQIMHNKFVVVDILRIMTGSYNFTEAAQKRNAENMLILHDKKTAQQYADNWGRHWSHSVRIPEEAAKQ